MDSENFCVGFGASGFHVGLLICIPNKTRTTRTRVDLKQTLSVHHRVTEEFPINTAYRKLDVYSLAGVTPFS